MARTTTLLVGVAMGTLGVLLYLKLRAVTQARDPEAVADRLGRQLLELESRSVRGGQVHAPQPTPA